MKKPLTTITLVSLLAISTATLAQYNGPGNQTPRPLAVLRSVAEVLKAPVDDQPVELTGVLMKQTGRETFQFRDTTGEIQVEIDRDDFPAGQPIGADTRVTLHGEVETRAMRAPEIEVESVVVTAAPAP
jgi:uncharacterized protein (TIGR00156 family)